MDGRDLLEQSLHYLQVGEWQAAIAHLSELVQRYPENQHYQDLLNEARLKARLRERPPRKRSSGVARSKRVWALIILNLIMWLILGGHSLYWHHIEPALAQSRALAAQQALIERGKEALLQEDLSTAQAIFREVLRRDPENSIAKQALADIERRLRLDEKYTLAGALAAEERWEEALALLQQIQAQAPGYRDVEAEIERLQHLQGYAMAFEDAERLFRAGQWVQAAQAFDRLRRVAPNFKAELVESRLFTSYMNQARALLDATPDTPTQEVAILESAMEWLARALELRPEDPEAVLQQRLVHNYLQGLQAYGQESWETAIIHLSSVYTAAPDYRAGRAAELLQNAYVQAGLYHLRNRRQERALERFRQAIAIGLQGHAHRMPGSARSLLVRADELADRDRLTEAVALYGQILVTMGFGEVAPMLPSVPTAAPEPWRQHLLCPAPSDALLCTDLLAWRRAFVGEPAQPEERPDTKPAADLTPAPQVYVVRPGDTLFEIALRFGTTIRALVKANPIIKDPWLIRPGWRLIIPVEEGR
jgi:tetratricopeptide (TPR) repeat protein